MPSKVDDLVLRVEAVLFAAGRPLSVAELSETLEVSDYRPVQAAVRRLAHNYENRQTALEVRRVGEKYALQLRETFVPTAHSMTPVEIPPSTLKVLTLIAYHQPLLQSVLVRMVGDGAYEEVRHLADLGFLRTEPKGSTLELTTTRQFAEYFGIASIKPEEIRTFLEQKLGVTRTAPPPPPAPTEAPAAEPSPAVEPPPTP